MIGRKKIFLIDKKSQFGLHSRHNKSTYLYTKAVELVFKMIFSENKI
jgi:hypothetical protein